MCDKLHTLLHLGDVEPDMRVQLHVLVMSEMDLFFDVLLEVGHLVQVY